MTAGRNYWLALFSETTWQEFLAAGAEVSGFRESRRHSVSQMKPGDYLLCYLIRAAKWVGILEVVSEPFWDNSRIWQEELFPSRVRVKLVASLTPETAIPIDRLRDRLSIFQNLRRATSWMPHLRRSATKWTASDGRTIVSAIMEAQQQSTRR